MRITQSGVSQKRRFLQLNTEPAKPSPISENINRKERVEGFMEQFDAMMPDWDTFDDLYARATARREEQFMPNEDGFPAESFEEFSETPLDFEEMAAALRMDVESVYTLTGTLNRYSPDYMCCCKILDKMIRRLGSFCVTKAVLEQKDFEFPSLKDLDLKDLYCMVSFNFRKTRTAFIDGKAKRNCADMGLLDLECRWVDLAEKLKATGEKIRLIESGKINIDSMLEQARIFKGEKAPRREGSGASRPFGTKTRSLPVIGSVARQMIAEKKEAEDPMDGGVNYQQFRDARPFPEPVFKPSKEIMALARQDEMWDPQTLDMDLPESAFAGAEEIEEAQPAVRKSRKQRRKEAALARAAKKEALRLTGEKAPVRV